MWFGESFPLLKYILKGIMRRYWGTWALVLQNYFKIASCSDDFNQCIYIYRKIQISQHSSSGASQLPCHHTAFLDTSQLYRMALCSEKHDAGNLLIRNNGFNPMILLKKPWNSRPFSLILSLFCHSQPSAPIAAANYSLSNT